MFEDRRQAAATAVQAHFDKALAAFDDLPVTRAMAHATRGGKRLRGFLVMESAHLHQIGPAPSVWPATAIEALHAYSLVHDDLPCMDDDDLRRGEPTVHIKWDEATAVLAGDALQTLAFELVTDPRSTLEANVRAELAVTLARASGAQGMVLGQALDIAAEAADSPLTLEDITALQQGKTGALIEWAATAGARMAGADVAPLQTYARNLGLAFQIADDLLDVTGDSATLGKAAQKDAKAGKATFVSLMGEEGARRKAKELVTTACDSLAPYGAAAAALKEAAQFVIARKH